jgi:hypothetical protein
MAIGRPIAVLTLSDDEHDRLERWARRPTTAQALAQFSPASNAFVGGSQTHETRMSPT